MKTQFTPRIYCFNRQAELLVEAAFNNMGRLARIKVLVRGPHKDRFFESDISEEALAYALKCTLNICAHNSLRAGTLFVRNEAEMPFGIAA